MKLKDRMTLMSVCLLLVSVTAGASDYKAWSPLLPETVGGMHRSGKPDGMNMETGGQFWSSLHQRYESDNSEKYVELILLGGNAPQMASFQMMSTMKMETEDQILKTVEVKKYKALLNLEKNEKRGTLMICLGEEMMAVIEATGIMKEAQIISLAEELPLDKFVAQAK